MCQWQHGEKAVTIEHCFVVVNIAFSGHLEFHLKCFAKTMSKLSTHCDTF